MASAQYSCTDFAQASGLQDSKAFVQVQAPFFAQASGLQDSQAFRQDSVDSPLSCTDFAQASAQDFGQAFAHESIRLNLHNSSCCALTPHGCVFAMMPLSAIPCLTFVVIVSYAAVKT